MARPDPPKDAPAGILVPQHMIDRLRRYMQDYPEINEIIQKSRFSDTMLAESIADAVDEWNMIDPVEDGQYGIIDISPYKIPLLRRPFSTLIVKLASVLALESGSIPMQFNEITVNGGNISENKNVQWRNISTTIQTVGARVREQIKSLKMKRAWEASFSTNVTEMYYPYMGGHEGVELYG